MKQVLRRAGRAAWGFRDSRVGYLALWTLVVVFLGRAAVQAYQDYTGLPPFDTAAVSLALVALGVHAAALPVKWYYLMRAEGADLGFLETGKIFYISQLSSYIPGGLWQYLEMGYRAAGDGTGLDEVAHSVAYLTGVTVTSALCYASLAAAAAFPAYRLPALAAAALIAGGTVLSADIVERLKRWLRQWIAVPPYQPSRRTLGTLFAVSITLWLVAGIFVFFLVDAVAAVTSGQFAAVSGAFAAAWAAGFLVLVVPGGLGVREGVLIYLLGPVFPRPAVLAVTVLARVLMMAGEVVMAASYAAAVGWRRR
ncbi:MAG: lysylphosphatidylglycerol synthase domain-containing protein [Candidatus Nanohaloarchaea archaeon]|nr:lysylphosphatidylglycerol synthase domain-containing protein [Candidatus Nanohaloarchaea archaeon]